MQTTYFIFKASHRDAVAAKTILEIFGNASGLVCNMSKSYVSPLVADNDVLMEISNTLYCQIAHLPITYLGLPQEKKTSKL
jgi:hypothetical protein